MVPVTPLRLADAKPIGQPVLTKKETKVTTWLERGIEET